MWIYALTIFLSAFLLFQVQPLIGKWILPWFGGGPAVWTVCMLFFQAALVGGYAYAHLVRTRLGPRGQALVHLAVIGAALALLPIAPSAGWKPSGGEDPTWRILALLAATVGLPYLALAATSPLLQAWFSVARPKASPYRLYALSNAGSLLALASYPFLVEPALRLSSQAAAWSVGFGAFVVLCGACALLAWRAGRSAGRAEAPAADPPEAGGEARPGAGARLLWLALPACGTVLLLAVTNQMCLDVAVVPFLWVLPLGLYLLSFILCFHSERLYWRPLFWPLLAAAAAGMLWLLYKNVHMPMIWQILGYGAGLFVCCMVCHGELARRKPDPRHLTAFYLTSAAGGAAGGLAVTVLAPLVLPAYFELHAGLWACFALAVGAFWHERARLARPRPRWELPLLGLGGTAVLAALGIALALDIGRQLEDSLSTTRSFYGVLQVTEYETGDSEYWRYTLCHGRILHGSQYANAPRRYRPTTYYGEDSGVGLAILSRRGESPLRVGVVGLGVGTLAAYGEPGDVFRFYEINPQVLRLATGRFTYLADSAARCDVVLGDARVSLEREPPQDYDVLALDAFSSDAIPVHLLTAEAFAVYRRHLTPGGVLAVHISNQYLDLRPVVLALAEHFGMGAAIIESEKDAEEAISRCTWVLLTEDAQFLESDAIWAAASVPEDEDEEMPALRLWTDDYSDLLGVLR